uniref:Uncharacterized protein n=1 Tax=Trichobilharzia regenti TaxID=157069 RepID=A0AA85K6F1_TRIRE
AGPSRIGQQPDLSECDSLLSVSRTEEINQLTQRVINLSHLQHLSVIAYETRSIYEKVKASMRVSLCTRINPHYPFGEDQSTYRVVS